jgi:uncharacterized membrane protein
MRHVYHFLATLVAFCILDFTWLGAVASGLYKDQLGHLMRADVQWWAAILFYVIYVAALIVLCVQPALAARSFSKAVFLGAVFGVAAYAAFDLTALALFKQFPVFIASVDMAWGLVLTASVSAISYQVGVRLFT